MEITSLAEKTNKTIKKKKQHCKSKKEHMSMGKYEEVERQHPDEK